MILPGRAWIQVESKHFSCPTDAQAAECRWRNLTVIQSGAAINSWLAASTGNISTPLILAYVLRNFSPPFLASLPNLTAFFTLGVFLLTSLFAAGDYLFTGKRELSAGGSHQQPCEPLALSPVTLPASAAVRLPFPSVSGRSAPAPVRGIVLFFSRGSHALLPSQGLSWLFLSPLSLPSLSMDFVFFLHLHIIVSYRHQAPVTFPTFLLPSQPTHLYKVISPCPLCLLYSFNPLHFVLLSTPVFHWKLLRLPSIQETLAQTELCLCRQG